LAFFLFSQRSGGFFVSEGGRLKASSVQKGRMFAFGLILEKNFGKKKSRAPLSLYGRGGEEGIGSAIIMKKRGGGLCPLSSSAEGGKRPE